MSQWFQRCLHCQQDIENGKMAEHLRECEKREPHTPFHGKPSEPIVFRESPKV